VIVLKRYMPRKAPAKKRQSTASKKEASTVKAGSKTRPAKPKRNAPASKSKSSGDSIDALVKKQLAALKRADTLFKDAVSIVEIYRKKHPELEQYIPSVDSTQREINVRGASSEDSCGSHPGAQTRSSLPLLVRQSRIRQASLGSKDVKISGRINWCRKRVSFALMPAINLSTFDFRDFN
jgi:hypothetical protein